LQSQLESKVITVLSRAQLPAPNPAVWVSHRAGKQRGT
jgi:hypothetical protein